MTIKEQIQSLLDTKPMTAKTVAAIHALLEDPTTATAKQLQADQRTISNLKKTIRNLKEQLAPDQVTKATSADPERLLDSLFQLQQQRASAINSSGFSVKFGSSEKSIPCLQADEKTIYLPAGTPAAIGSHVNADSEFLGIITGTKAEAGRNKCTLWKAGQNAAIHEKTATSTGWNLRKSGGSVPCQFSDDMITTFGKSFPVGTILQCAGSFFEVLSSKQAGQLVHHEVRVFTLAGNHQAPAGKFKAPTMLRNPVFN